MARVYNFNAGPAALPVPVLEKARDEMLECGNSGMSVMEMSHRSKDFAAIIEAAEANIRELMDISDEYAVLFLQGGASLQFAMIPMNLRHAGRAADYVDTGSWATKAIKEAKATGDTHVIWDGKLVNYSRAPRPQEIEPSVGAAYVHICSNETIGGIRFAEFPHLTVPLIADMSSEIMSREIDVKRFGLIYAGAQKNMGPSGLALVIMRKDLLGRASAHVPVFLRYDTHSEDGSLYNTPNTWGIYILKLITDLLIERGGLPVMQIVNEEKAAALYGLLDSSDFWRTTVEKESRSIMNVVWRLPSEELEEQFVADAKKAGFVGLKGHRSVGGIRASIYNAVTREAVDELISFMKDFEMKNG